MPARAVWNGVSSDTVSASGESLGLVAVVAMLLGAVAVGYGLLVLSTSGLGGVWIAAIGLSLGLSGVFATDRGGSRLRLSASFADLAAVLLVAFVAVNFAAFEAGEATSGGGSS